MPDSKSNPWREGLGREMFDAKIIWWRSFEG